MFPFLPPMSWFDPPNVYYLDVLNVSDDGRRCDTNKCANHAIVKVREESFRGWGDWQMLCADCAYADYDLEVNKSQYDKEILV